MIAKLIAFMLFLLNGFALCSYAPIEPSESLVVPPGQNNQYRDSLTAQRACRGAEFKPLTFETRTATAERLKDSRGRSIWTVYADELADTEVEKRKAKGQEDEDKVLILMLKANTPPSPAEIAMHCGWIYATGDPNKSKATRILEKLEKEGFVKKERGESYQLTEKGKRAAKEAEDAPF